VRWSIENDVFKKLSGLVKTKRFRFKEQRPFLSMVRIICGALAAYDLTSFFFPFWRTVVSAKDGAVVNTRSITDSLGFAPFT